MKVWESQSALNNKVRKKKIGEQEPLGAIWSLILMWTVR